MHKEQRARRTGVLMALGLQSLVAIILFLVGAWRNHSDQYWYLIWNLFLAWIPLVLAYGLVVYLRTHAWWTWRGGLLSFLWLGFLPNSFYMVSDFIHITSDGRVDVVSDVIMLAAFSISGLTLGFISLYLIHREFIKRFRLIRAHQLIALVLLLCSFAIYLGRNLRWNTWDILINPAGVLFDVSDPLFAPRTHPEAAATTLGFFVLLGSIYIVIWQFVSFLHPSKQA